MHAGKTIPLTEMSTEISYNTTADGFVAKIVFEGLWERLQIAAVVAIKGTAMSLSITGGIRQIPGQPYMAQDLLSTLSFGMLDNFMRQSVAQTNGPSADAFSTFINSVLDMKITKADLHFNMEIGSGFLLTAEVEVSIFSVAKVFRLVEVRQVPSRDFEVLVILPADGCN